MSFSAHAREALAARDFAKAEEHLLRSLDLIAAEINIVPMGPPPTNPQNKVRKFLYLPVEMAGRELASRAWIAGECAKLGFNVIIGATWSLSYNQWKDLPPGIVLFKTLYALDAKQFWLAKDAGHCVAVLDEEMLPLALNRRIYEFSCEPQALALADLVCAPGEASAAILREMTPGKVVVTGNPRAMAPKTHTGGKILVCTSTAAINPTMGFETSMKMTLRVAGKPLKGDVLDIWRGQIAHECRWTPLMLDAITALKAKYGESVHVRPHPAEDPSTFGFEVDREPLSTRLSEADCVVFVSSCGIGIEAAMAGVPAVRLGHGGDGLSATFGEGAEDVDGVLGLVGASGSLPIPDLTGIITRDITLPQELEKLWEANAMDPAAPIRVARRTDAYFPDDFERKKFRETTVSEITELVGLPAVRLGWNVYAIKACST